MQENLVQEQRSVVDTDASVERAYSTDFGQMLVGKIEDALNSRTVNEVKGKVNLILTSPPFPLVRKKAYGNTTGQEYLEWIEGLAPQLANLLADDGSIVIEIGNAWIKGEPEMSTLPLETLLAFKKAANLHLCQEIICHNPARLPGPAAWVTVDRVRLKDSYTHVWWLSKTPRPKADNKKVLVPYSKSMEALIKRKSYNAGLRPSGHRVSDTTFLKRHEGAISPSVIDLESERSIPNSLLQFANTGWDKNYRSYCKERGIDAHPARMQSEMVAFFVEFLSDKHDLIFDPFGGSNTTGAVSEKLGRRWMSVEADANYAEGSIGRFESVQR